MFSKSFKQDVVDTAQSGIVDWSQTTGAMNLPVGTSAQRPSNPVVGTVRWNTTTASPEIYNGTSWVPYTLGAYSYTVSYLVVTGGGGGGSYVTSAGGAGGVGGSGVVIISVPTANYTGTVTGSPTVTTSGSNTIIKFTSSGTYTA